MSSSTKRVCGGFCPGGFYPDTVCNYYYCSVSGNCHKFSQTSCLGLSFETINNELCHLEGVKTILTPDRV